MKNTYSLFLRKEGHLLEDCIVSTVSSCLSKNLNNPLTFPNFHSTLTCGVFEVQINFGR